MGKSLYTILFDLESTRDGDTDDEYYGVKAVFGENLDRLIADLQAERDSRSEDTAKFTALTKERDDLKKELDAIKKELADAFKDGGEVKTSQGKRYTYPGEIVLFTSAGGTSYPAMVMEVCGFPVGKIKVRTFTQVPSADSLKYAMYREQGEMRAYQDTWRFLP